MTDSLPQPASRGQARIPVWVWFAVVNAALDVGGAIGIIAYLNRSQGVWSLPPQKLPS